MYMVNDMSTGEPECMKLIRLLALNNLRINRRVTVEYVKSAENVLADSLSRGEYDRFWKHAPEGTNRYPDSLPSQLWPIDKLWVDK